MAAARIGILPAVRLHLIVFALATLAQPVLRAASTNVVDAIALGRIGTGVSPDGWTVSGVNNYSDSYKFALRFDTKDDLVQSPVFANPVTRVLLKASSSSAAGRRLAFTPVRDDAARTNLTRLCAYSKTKNVFLAQTLSWPRNAGVHAFRIHLEGGGNTGWGILEMSVIFDDPASGTVISLR